MMSKEDVTAFLTYSKHTATCWLLRSNSSQSCILTLEAGQLRRLLLPLNTAICHNIETKSEVNSNDHLTTMQYPFGKLWVKEYNKEPKPLSFKLPRSNSHRPLKVWDGASIG